MTDKEWYAQLSTLVLEGIDQINKGQDTWRNQYKIKSFVRDETTPEEKKAKMRRKVFQNLSKAMNKIGYIGGFIFLLIDGFAWMICLAEGFGLLSPIVLLLMAVTFGAMGLAGQIWCDLL